MPKNGFGGTQLFTIDLPSDIEKRLLVMAMHKGRAVQFCAREAILDYIDEVEERFLAIDRVSEEESVDGYDLLD
tara:strand:- start:1041 stop:1262 length:222 start_codon:yes stop_codon:yes gene_type:complete